MITDETSISDEIDASAYAEAANDILAKAREAIAKGEQPTSATGLGVAREWLDIIAKVMQRDADEAFMEWARKHQAHSLRYRELLAILRNDDKKQPSGREWLWLNAAMSIATGRLIQS